MTDWLHADAVRELLRKQVTAAGSIKAWASHHGISVPYVWDVLNSARPPGDKIAAAMGLEKVIMWKKATRR